MKTKVSRAGVALVALLATAGTAMAEGEWSGNVAMTSDYTWRGVSQSNEDPAIQGGFDYANGLFYAGTWASNVDFGDDSVISPGSHFPSFFQKISLWTNANHYAALAKVKTI